MILISSRTELKQWIVVLCVLIAADVCFWILLHFTQIHVDPVSRRIANLPYVIWMVRIFWRFWSKIWHFSLFRWRITCSCYRVFCWLICLYLLSFIVGFCLTLVSSCLPGFNLWLRSTFRRFRWTLSSGSHELQWFVLLLAGEFTHRTDQHEYVHSVCYIFASCYGHAGVSGASICCHSDLAFQENLSQSLVIIYWFIYW